MAEAPVAALLMVGGAAYALGLRRAWGGAGRGRLITLTQARCFAAALIVLAVALLPPLAARAGRSLTAHMVQHVALLVVAAPLLAMGAPVPALVWALPDRWRGRARGGWRRLLAVHARRWVPWAAAALLLETAAMWAWHAPALYRGAVRHEALHGLEHASFVLTATAFWWAVGLGGGRRHGAAVPIVFVAALPGTALGAAITLAGRPWYAEYPSLADQQMAGVVMWAFAGLAYVLAAAALFGLWLAGLERDTPGRPVVAAVNS